MIGPVSEVGKTMLSSLQGAMAKGMPVDQAIQYVKSQAATGVAPLVDLYALLKQFERLKQPPAQNPQGGTLKEQLNNLESSIVGGQRGLAGLGGPTSYYEEMQDPMSLGLGAIDAGAMENPQGFNAGGIVAFAEGGQSQTAKPITPQLYTLPKSYEELAQARMAEEAALKTPEGRAALLRAQDEEMKAAGLGKYAKSLEMRDQLAEEAAKRAELLPGEEAALNEESFWADVAGTDQPDLISAMAKSKAKAVERKRQSKVKVQAAKEKAAEAKVLRQEAREALARGDIELYKTKLKEAETLKNTSVDKYIAEVEADKDAEVQAKRARDLAYVQANSTPLARAQEELRTTPRFINGEPNPRVNELQAIIAGMQSGKGGRSRSDIAYYKNIYDKASSALRKAQENDAAYGTEETATALAAAQRAAEMARRNYESAALGEDVAAPTGAMPSDFTQMSNEELVAEMQRQGLI